MKLNKLLTQPVSEFQDFQIDVPGPQKFRVAMMFGDTQSIF